MERNKYNPEYKSKIVVEILREETSISEIASREDINKNQLQNWKREFLENSAKVFAQSKIEKDAVKTAREAEEREHNGIHIQQHRAGTAGFAPRRRNNCGLCDVL